MRFEWFVKQIIGTINGKTDISYALLTPERSTTVDGALRYVGNAIQIYVGDKHVYVDIPLYMYDTALVLRATCPIQNNDTVTAMVRATYASANVTLKALFFHSIETLAMCEDACDRIRIDVIGVVRYFCQWCLDKASYSHSTDLLRGWMAADMVDIPVHLSYSAHPDTGNIVFHDPTRELRHDDMTRYGWISVLATAYQPEAKPYVAAESAVNDLANTDLQLMFNAGCGREIHHWRPAINEIAIPSLKALV